jgi:pyruvate,water dikinase
MKYIIHLEDAPAVDAARVGQKFAVLAKAHGGGYPVPPAIAVTTDAHRFFLENRRWPKGLSREVSRAAKALGLEKGVSIRSSATREDLENQSFAGQYRTFLEICSESELWERIEQCWLSAESEDVRSYLNSMAEADRTSIPLMGIIVQRMVHARAAGVAFSRNPMRPARREAVVEAVDGLADKLVNGHATPYRAVVSEDGRVSADPSRGDKPSHATDNRRLSLMDLEQWRRVAQLARNLEQTFEGTPQDIEWAIDGDDIIWLLQARAITALAGDVTFDTPGVWTRKIANDLWADRLSPFMADVMERTAPRWNLSRVSRWIGIPVVEPALAVINGYLYLNCESISAAVGALPRALRLDFLESLVPPEAGLASLPPPCWHHSAARLVRLAALPLYQPGSIPQLSLRSTRSHIRSTEKRLEEIKKMPDRSPGAAYRKLGAVLGTLTRIQEKNQWPYFYAATLTWGLRWLLTQRFDLTHTDFLNLVARGGRNISIAIEEELRRISRRILSDDANAEVVRRCRPEEAVALLPEPLANDIRRFVARYGCRSRHRSLYVKRWAEDPVEVLSILQRLVQHGLPETVTPAVGRRMAALPFAVRWLTGLTVRFLDLREDLRFLLDRCLFQLRLTLLRLGELCGPGELVFFLTPAELCELAEGRGAGKNFTGLARRRQEAFLEPSEVSTFVVDGRPVDEFSPGDLILRGVGTSPGRIRGHARVVIDPTTDDFEKGDILIARNTDPGWTPILSIVGGMIMEEGGLLNHCSIVARELGIPSIVGVEHATRRIPDGSLVQLDGGRGIVRILDAPETGV